MHCQYLRGKVNTGFTLQHRGCNDLNIDFCDMIYAYKFLKWNQLLCISCLAPWGEWRSGLSVSADTDASMCHTDDTVHSILSTLFSSFQLPYATKLRRKHLLDFKLKGEVRYKTLINFTGKVTIQIKLFLKRTDDFKKM